MGNRRRWLFGLGIILLVGVLTWEYFQTREPVYHGRPLSYWLGAYNYRQPNRPSRLDADWAVREMGAKTIPTLLKLLQAREAPPWKLRLLAWSRKQPWFTFDYLPPEFRHAQGAQGFAALGPQAAGAVPELVKIYDRNLSPVSQQEIAGVLGGIGPGAQGAVPVLLRETASPDAFLRGAALEALGKIHAQPGLVLPALMQALNDPAPANRLFATSALAAYGEEARPIVPALVEIIRQTPATPPPPLLVPLAMTVRRSTNAQSGVQLTANIGQPEFQTMMNNATTPAVAATKALKKIAPQTAAELGIR